ncbi:uncharacterized protein F4807DRAFT_454953 [Annulohypoxylon truncatum]|uniref:uncharacterized protein n=1 Tax=Annulohypoxylon truncatum TaxID=327061 RepID=UPI0020084298|nr:uncharacterized protein F4807DRAFT_454953 [Annulohypoxylon truncatum]KAI1214500.1 hypothetical protein F4807DRAFT_454953 [Annulohypoxylon truncatum]
MADTPYHPHFPSSQLRSPSPPLSPLSSIPHGGIHPGGDPQDSHDTHDIHDTYTRRRSLPFVFSPLPKNTSSTFLIPSTAEGRPIPLDDSTAAHRTTALRQLSRSQPSSRHRYTGASSSPSIKSTTTGTYSQPVVVRTYSGVPPSPSTRGPVSVSTLSPSPNPQPQRPSRNGPVKNMARHKRNEKTRTAAGAKLPPLESFTFKSIIADIQQDVGADLDRIAEICARTRYSLSNQYEVHIAPQGSGAGFLGPPPPSFRHHAHVGPTLQAVTSDEEHMGPIQPKKRRNAARRRSVAYGTLETIMSSSRSSDEDRSSKKPAAEIVEEVRGRVTMDNSAKDESGSANSTDAQASSEQHDDQRICPPTRSALFAAAIIDTSRSQTQGVDASHKAPGAVLLSDPAEPRTSRNHLQTKTSPEVSTVRHYTRDTAPRPSRAVASESVAAAAITIPEEPRASSGLLAGFTTWISWKGADSDIGLLGSEGTKGYSSYAEGTLRELLRSTESLMDPKRKGIDLT